MSSFLLYASLYRPLTVYFAPKNDDTIAIMEILRENFLQFPANQMTYNGEFSLNVLNSSLNDKSSMYSLFSVSGYESEDDLIDDYVAVRDNVLGAVIFYKTADNSIEVAQIIKLYSSCESDSIPCKTTTIVQFICSMH